MNAQTKPAKSATKSRRLENYKLTARHRTILETFKKLEAYMRDANKAPPCLRLSHADYVDIDARIRNQSMGGALSNGPHLSQRSHPIGGGLMDASLEIGDHVETHVSGRKTLHTIAARKIAVDSASTFVYRIAPSVPGYEWLDASQVEHVHGYSHREVLGEAQRIFEESDDD